MDLRRNQSVIGDHRVYKQVQTSRIYTQETRRVYIFNDTIAANVSYGEDLDDLKVIEALKQAHAYEFVLSMKKGINTVLDEFGTNLSGGQRQRIAIARALYKILFFIIVF